MENLVIVEVKCVEAIHPVHEAQLLSYLRLSKKNVGLLINFHVAHLKDGIKRHGGRMELGKVTKTLTTGYTEMHRGTLCFTLCSSMSPVVKILDLLDLTPKFLSRIFWIELAQFAQQFFRLLVSRHRDRNPDFDDLISAHSVLSRRGHAFSRSRSFWPDCVPGGIFNMLRPSIVGTSIFDPSAASTTVTGTVMWMSSPSRWKSGCSPDAYDDVKIADPASAQSGIAFTRDAYSLPVARPGLDADLERIGALDAAFAVADRAGRKILARPVASRTLHVELHPPAGLRDLPVAIALRTFARSFQEALARGNSRKHRCRECSAASPRRGSPSRTAR